MALGKKNSQIPRTPPPDANLDVTSAMPSDHAERRDTTYTSQLSNTPLPFVIEQKKIDRYDIVYQLAKGGMASVFVGQLSGMAGFEKLVAIKVVHPHLSTEKQFIEMFLDEARVAARIVHPNVAQLQSMGQENGLLYMVGELVLGQDLRSMLRKMREGQVKPSSALAADICSKVALGLHAVHELRGDDKQLLNVVHRDVSPSNILISYDGHVKLIDFGIAHAKNRCANTRNGELKGKPAYMSPEQIRGEVPDRRSDIYSLGVNLYYLATGRNPFSGTIDTQLFNKILRGDFLRPREVDPNIPLALEEIILRAMAQDRNDRYATGLDMSHALEDFSRAIKNHARPDVIAKGMQCLFATELLEHEAKVTAFRERRRLEALERTINNTPMGLRAIPRRSDQTDRVQRNARIDAGRLGPPIPASARRKGNALRIMPLALLALVLLLATGLSGPYELLAGTATHDQPYRAQASISSRSSKVINSEQDARPIAVRSAPVAPIIAVPFEVSPADAQIKIDGVEVSRDTRHVKMLQDGKTHVFEAKATGYHSQRQDFVVSEKVVLTAELQRKSRRDMAVTSHDSSRTAVADSAETINTNSYNK